MKDYFYDKRVFVTGHTSCKGACLTHILRRLGAKVTGFALPATTKEKQYFFERATKGSLSIFGDIRDADALKTALNIADPEIIFHLAQMSLSSKNKCAEVFETNFMGVLNLLEAAREAEKLCSVIIAHNTPSLESARKLVDYYNETFFYQKNIELIFAQTNEIKNLPIKEVLELAKNFKNMDLIDTEIEKLVKS